MEDVDASPTDGEQSPTAKLDFKFMKEQNEKAYMFCKDNDKAFYDHKKRHLFSSKAKLSPLEQEEVIRKQQIAIYKYLHSEIVQIDRADFHSMTDFEKSKIKKQIRKLQKVG